MLRDGKMQIPRKLGVIMKIAVAIAKIVDLGNVKLGAGDAQDMNTVRVTLPTAKIVDRGNVKLGAGDAQDMKTVRVTLPTAKIVDRRNVKLGDRKSTRLNSSHQIISYA